MHLAYSEMLSSMPSLLPVPSERREITTGQNAVMLCGWQGRGRGG